MSNQSHYELGMVGLGVMGRNLLLNMADHQFSVAGYDNDATKVSSLVQESQGRPIFATSNLKEFVQSLRAPRAIILLVPAGAIVDSVINELVPHLSSGDLIIDAGNSYFKDTDRRTIRLATHSILFMGVGVSGGEEGARHGPSIMPGGSKEAYERVRLVFEAIAAQVNNEPCVTYIGLGSSGHFVKMVHNGIEYGVMQLISESYALMKLGLGLDTGKLAAVYTLWNQGKLNGYLMEITARIFAKSDLKTNKPLIDEIIPVAAQKGTGMWTSQIAMDLQVPIPCIDIAVMMRDLSGFVKERDTASTLYPLSLPAFSGDKAAFIDALEHALIAGIITVYAQGMALLKVASDTYHYQLNLEAISKIWRGGCIIRSALLDDISTAFQANPELPNLLLNAKVAQQLITYQKSLRHITCEAVRLGIAIPGLMQSISYFDSYRSAWLPANLIQAQRDYFGAHTYERIDTKGAFHTEWEK